MSEPAIRQGESHQGGEAAARDELLRVTVVTRLCERYGLDPAEITDDRPFADLGLASTDAVALAGELSLLIGEPLPATLLWDTPTLGVLRERLALPALSGPPQLPYVRGEFAPPSGWVPERESGRGSGPESGPGSGPESEPRHERATEPGARAVRPEAPAPRVAVVGVGCRLPGADGPEEFWRLLSEGRDAVTTVPDGRWAPFGHPGEGSGNEVSPHGGYLADIAGFDAEFFGITPREAAAMDPQQRMLLEVAREALDHAALPAPSLAGTHTGVYVGISGNEYAQLTTASLDAVDAWTPAGAALSIAANRLSYAMDLRGPSLALDTACSSSLVATHHAVRGLVSHECDTALVGGVNLLLSPAVTLAFQRAGALAPRGRSRAFDAGAEGMVRGEGCAVLVLKRLEDAERDGDRVLAVIRSTAVNSDGRSNGMLAPNPEAQRALLHRVHHAEGPVPPDRLDYVEAHGTGTPLGDPIEAEALGRVLGAGRAAERPLLIGSVKTNTGHLEAAAGVTGLVKTVLALAHDEIPPSLHFHEPSPHIDFPRLGLRVTADPEPWPRYSGTATAGVSSFGFGGTNAHVVLQEHPAPPPRNRPQGAGPVTGSRTAPGAATGTPADTGSAPGSAAPAVLLLDAPSEDRLREYAADLARWLGTRQARAVHPYDLAHTLAGRTGRGRHRAAVLARDLPGATEGLTALSEGRSAPQLTHGGQHFGPRPAGARTRRGPVWVFSGYGSQWPGMGHGLLAAEPAFADAVDRLEPLLAAHAGVSLSAHLEPGAELESIGAVQPVLFGVQTALAALWRAHGVEPSAVIGHSMGEVAAAVATGALTEEDGARVIGARSRLLARLTGGAMATVELSGAEVAALRGRFPSVRVAVHASPRQSVVTGADPEIEELVAHVESRGGLARTLPVTVAGHSAHVDPLLGELAALLAPVTPRTPSVPHYSTVLEDPREVVPLDAGYWTANLRRPVRFAQAVAAAAEDGHRVFTEISPHPTQLHPLAECLRAADAGTGRDGAGQDREPPLLAATLRRGTDDAYTFRTSLAALLAHGHEARRATLHPGARVIDVPTQRWRHGHHWVTTTRAPVPAAAPDPAPDPAPAPEPAHAPSPPVVDAPATVLERLCAAVGDVLGYPPGRLDPAAPLTDLGLDSLMAARIRTCVEREFGVTVPTAALLRHGTLEALATRLDPGHPSSPRPRPGGGRVLPRDAAERAVASAWRETTGEPLPDVRRALLAPGESPDGAQAARLAQAVADRTGVHPEAATLLAPPATVESAADRLRPLLDAAPTGPLRPLAPPPPGGASLFLAHPAGGTSAVYRPLAERLSAPTDSRTGYGSHGLERLAGPGQEAVTERARRYARLLRETEPEGPWILAGWSYGGVLAHETARLLTAGDTGRPEAPGVRALVLIDSVLPLPPRRGRTPLQEARRRFGAFAAYVERTYGSPLPLPYEELAALDDTGQIELVVKALEQTVDPPRAVLEHQRTSYLDLRSGERHTPGTFAGPTLLLRATDPAPHSVHDERYARDDEDLGWSAHCQDLTVVPVPGHHLSLLDPPAVDVVGARIADFLER